MNTQNPTPAAQITVVASCGRSADGTVYPYFIDATVPAEYVDQFPKSAALKYGTGRNDDKKAIIDLKPRKGNDRNEGGIKRYNSIVKTAAKLGLEVKFSTPNVGYLTAEEFAAAVAL